MKPKRTRIPYKAHLPCIVRSIGEVMYQRGRAYPDVWLELEDTAKTHSRTVFWHITSLLFGANLRHGKLDMQRQWLALGEDVLMEHLWQRLERYAHACRPDLAFSRGGLFAYSPSVPTWLRG